MRDKIQEALSLAEIKVNGNRLNLANLKPLPLTSCPEELPGLRIPPPKITPPNLSFAHSIKKTRGSPVPPSSAS